MNQQIRNGTSALNAQYVVDVVTTILIMSRCVLYTALCCTVRCYERATGGDYNDKLRPFDVAKISNVVFAVMVKKTSKSIFSMIMFVFQVLLGFFHGFDSNGC
jgi:hypothetical protein